MHVESEDQAHENKAESFSLTGHCIQWLMNVCKSFLVSMLTY